MGWFKHWFGTRYYAVLYGHRDEDDARRWVDAILDRWRPASGVALLDMACGRGRHAAFFAEAGLRVTGIDISAASIEEARRNVPNAEFAMHDMREPFRAGTFDAVCCLFTSLGYFDDLEDDKAVLRAVYTALKPGGRFVLDFMNTAKVIRELVTEEHLTRDGIGFALRRTLEEGVLVKHITVQDGPECHRYEERVQALTAEQLEHMALEAGFEVEDRTDGPMPTPFDRELSDRFVLWLRKPRT